MALAEAMASITNVTVMKLKYNNWRSCPFPNGYHKKHDSAAKSSKMDLKIIKMRNKNETTQIHHSLLAAF
jgi:hypothetical protein